MLVLQHLPGLPHGHAAADRAPGKEAFEHLPHAPEGLAPQDPHEGEGDLLLHLDLHKVAVQAARADLGHRGAEQGGELLLGEGQGLFLHLLLHLLQHELVARLRQVADDGVHVPAHVPHLGELGGLHLHEGGPGEAGEAAGDLGLSHPRGPDHEDVLGGDLPGDLRGSFLRR